MNVILKVASMAAIGGLMLLELPFAIGFGVWAISLWLRSEGRRVRRAGPLPSRATRMS